MRIGNIVFGKEEKRDKGPMERKILSNSAGKDISFTGKLLGEAYEEVEDPEKQVPKRQLYLYETRNGKYVCHKVDLLKDEITVTDCETVEKVIETFGWGLLAKTLYEDAEIDTALWIEEVEW
ncbi:hypothetical protein ACFL35_08535 [Candidatus Riflebacteria bacterium]